MEVFLRLVEVDVAGGLAKAFDEFGVDRGVFLDECADGGFPTILARFVLTQA